MGNGKMPALACGLDCIDGARCGSGPNNAPTGCVGLSPPRAKMARRAKKRLGGDGFGRLLAKKGLGSDEAWTKSVPTVTITE